MTLPPTPPSAAKLTAAFLSSLLPSPPPPDLLLFFAAALSFLIALKHPPFPRLHLRRRPLPPPPLPPPSMTLPPPPPPSPSPSLSFSSPQSLSDWLTPLLPPGSLSSWGSSPGTKTLHNLWLELSHGETSLFLPSDADQQQSSPLRAVHVTVVKIRNSRGALLVESHQLLSDGTVRQRGRPLSEKMKPGETVEEAAVRAVEEELGVSAASGSVRVLPGSYAVRVEEKASVSYPGLPARYVLHSVEAQVESLPEEGEFSTEERGEGGEELRIGSAVFVRKHFWKWIEDSDCPTPACVHYKNVIFQKKKKNDANKAQSKVCKALHDLADDDGLSGV